MVLLLHNAVYCSGIIFLALFVSWACPVDGKIRETADAIIIEAEEWQDQIRQPRSSVDLQRVPGSTTLMTERNNCWTPDGQTGFCGSLRSCYPNYKLPPLNNLEMWVLGTKGTCHYVEPDGRQMYGICCPRKLNPDEIIFGGEESVLPLNPTPNYVDPSDPEAQKLQQLQHEVAARAGCGQGPYKTSKIVGGNPAARHSWPFIVSLQTNGRHFCGGSIWKENLIITAAHCVAHFTSFDVPKVDVVAGLHSISDSSATKRKIQRIIRHKGYNGKTMVNDIAVLVLASPLNFNDDKIGPVCLPNGGNIDTSPGKEAVVIGWGSLKQGGGSPSELHEVTVRIVPDSECRKKYGSQYDIVDHMLCAASPGKDSCQGDSGGPLIRQNGEAQPWYLIGAVSWGIGCAQAEYPGVYTRITSFMDWMIRNAS